MHSVDPVIDQKGWDNVMYVPAAPYCPKNAAYAERCGQAFLAGETPDDFAYAYDQGLRNVHRGDQPEALTLLNWPDAFVPNRWARFGVLHPGGLRREFRRRCHLIVTLLEQIHEKS